MTNNLKMFCLTLEPNHQSFIKEMGYVPVGLGKKFFQKIVLVIKKGTIFHKKISITENIHFIIGCGKII